MAGWNEPLSSKDGKTLPSLDDTSKFPVLGYNFGDPYLTETAQREKLLKKNRLPGFSVSTDVNCFKGLDVQQDLNESLLMSDAELNM